MVHTTWHKIRILGKTWACISGNQSNSQIIKYMLVHLQLFKTLDLKALQKKFKTFS